MSRVTLVVNFHDVPSETFQRSLATTLARAGHEVTLHSVSSGTAPEVGPAGARPAPLHGVAISRGLPPLSVRSAPRLVGPVLRSSERAMVVALRRARARFGTGSRATRAALVAAPILGTRPDVVHLGFSGTGVAIRDALDLLDGIALVVSCRGTDELVRPLLDPGRAEALADLLSIADRVHVVADAVGEVVAELGADRDRVRVIRPAVDLDRWTPRPAATDLADRPYRLLAVGRLVGAKAHGDLLAALAAVRANGIDARLTVVGDGPERDVLRLRSARAGLDDAVALVGARSSSDVLAWLGDSDLFVSASLSEGINNGVLEAMARQVPVVATDVGGMAEVITDGVDGWLVPPSRPDLLAGVVRTALADARLRGRVAEAGRSRVVTAFGLERQRTEWSAFYDDVPVGSPQLLCRNVRPREGTR